MKLFWVFFLVQICANSSRPARWDSKLGFQRDPRPFLLPISSLYSGGGPVGCLDVVILRSYPLQVRSGVASVPPPPKKIPSDTLRRCAPFQQWMERKPDGGVVFRSVRAEEREERRYNVGKQKAMEALFTKIQSEFEREDKGRREHLQSCIR